MGSSFVFILTILNGQTHWMDWWVKWQAQPISKMDNCAKWTMKWVCTITSISHLHFIHLGPLKKRHEHSKLVHACLSIYIAQRSHNREFLLETTKARAPLIWINICIHLSLSSPKLPYIVTRALALFAA